MCEVFAVASGAGVRDRTCCFENNKIYNEHAKSCNAKRQVLGTIDIDLANAATIFVGTSNVLKHDTEIAGHPTHFHKVFPSQHSPNICPNIIILRHEHVHRNLSQ